MQNFKHHQERNFHHHTTSQRAAPVETPQKTSQKTVLLVHTGHDVEHQVPEDNEGIQREVRSDQEDQPRRLTHKLVSTVGPSKR